MAQGARIDTTPCQRLPDRGTGTGLPAREWTWRDCVVSGTDIAPGQIDAARQLAQAEGLSVDFQVAPVEARPHADASFDAVAASPCWLHFDSPRAIAKVRRVLELGGVLVTTHYSWLPRLGPIVRASEALLLRFNPSWQGTHRECRIPSVPPWSVGLATVQAMFWFDEAAPAIRESWRGRMRACRGMGATLAPAEVAAFDIEHQALLERLAPENFHVLHRVDADLYRPL